ncbi:MAG: 3-isopropylmalate dehydratase small subunit [Desulfuromonadales bacterium]|nr:3-isopropylmalate dehydratase small subunit [Desulfuromonadales bacterium]MDW7758922.1 3-isopropylmalate dehydratase small subunit [Desulfuromonadales bacterium]
MKTTVAGRAFVFGKNIDTDQIYPGRFVELTREEDIARYAMAGADPEFVQKFRPGDLVVAATNFGCGSSREHAAITLKAVGVGAILAESFGRIFYRNAINLGVPLLVCPQISSHVKDGDTLEVDIESGKVVNRRSGAVLQAQPLAGYPLEILRHGGIKPMMKKRMAQGAGGGA